MDEVNFTISAIHADSTLSDAIQLIWQGYSVLLVTRTVKAVEHTDKQTLGPAAAQTNASVVYVPSSTTGGNAALTYSESKFNRTEVQLLKDGNIMASSRPQWRSVPDSALTFIGDMYWGNEWENPAASFPVTVSFTIDNHNSLLEPLTLESVSFSLDDIEMSLHFPERRTGEISRVKSLSALFLLSTSGEITTSIRLKPIVTQP